MIDRTKLAAKIEHPEPDELVNPWTSARFDLSARQVDASLSGLDYVSARTLLSWIAGSISITLARLAVRI